MALNKYMHPRNIYKTPPNFTELAKSFQEFSSISKVDVTGKVSIDFKDPHSLRVLTRCLLKSDFGLDVDIPKDRLVPTLPLRLNYILWVEDLLNSVERRDNINGLDIGTGACAIYPLLAAAKNKWHMVGTETDLESLQKAQENVEKNRLQDLIQVRKNPTASLMEFLFKDENSQTYDFCMCNPPFYSNVQELCESRSPARLPPKNGFTGSPQELITEGGELAFCRQMIKESKEYKDNVLIFTTMVGHKYNLKELTQDLKADDIKYTNTEFCQGRVTRWGLAWTYKEFEICNLVPAREKLRKTSLPIVYIFPQLPGFTYNFETVSKKLLELLQDLKIDIEVLSKRGTYLSLDIKAVENTWSNQRRKRRLLKALNKTDPKKLKIIDTDTIDIGTCEKSVTKLDVEVLETKSKKPENMDSKIDHMNIDNRLDTSRLDIKQKNVKNTEQTDCVVQTNKIILSVVSEADTMEPVEFIEELMVHAFLKVLKKDNDILVKMEYLNGTVGKEGLHQIMQYIKNNWK